MRQATVAMRPGRFAVRAVLLALALAVALGIGFELLPRRAGAQEGVAISSIEYDAVGGVVRVQASGQAASNARLFIDGVEVDTTVVELASPAGASSPVVFAIEASSSTAPVQLARMQQAALAVIAQLPAGTPVSVVQFGDASSVLVNGTTDRSAAEQAVRSITPGSMSVLYDGVRVANEVAAPGSTVVVMTWGWNFGGAPTTRPMAVQAVLDGDAQVLAYAFGSDYDAPFLGEIAAASGGAFEVAPATAEALAAGVLGRLGSVPGPSSYELIAIAPGLDAGVHEVRVEAGGISSSVPLEVTGSAASVTPPGVVAPVATAPSNTVPAAPRVTPETSSGAGQWANALWPVGLGALALAAAAMIRRRLRGTGVAAPSEPRVSLLARLPRLSRPRLPSLSRGGGTTRAPGRGGPQPLVTGGRLKTAMENDEIETHFQPVFTLADGRIAGAEALLRWQQPGFGEAATARMFLGRAAHSGMLEQIGNLALRPAFELTRELQRAGVSGLRLSVNVSGEQLAVPEQLYAVVKDALEGSSLSSWHLEIEVPEQVLAVRGAELAPLFTDLSALGVGLVVDDFWGIDRGVEVLSLPGLRGVKVDLWANTGSPGAREQLRVAVAAAHARGLFAVAKRVETDEELAFASEIGCDFAQGHHFARPMPAAEYRAYALRYGAETPDRLAS
jgi:EAL domain-containing protein (putative c-di-GMP-specific phosphodiesterase class I)/Mg-chelatase subunit ChlD